MNGNGRGNDARRGSILGKPVLGAGLRGTFINFPKFVIISCFLVAAPGLMGNDEVEGRGIGRERREAGRTGPRGKVSGVMLCGVGVV